MLVQYARQQAEDGWGCIREYEGAEEAQKRAQASAKKQTTSEQAEQVNSACQSQSSFCVRGRQQCSMAKSLSETLVLCWFCDLVHRKAVSAALT